MCRARTCVSCTCMLYMYVCCTCMYVPHVMYVVHVQVYVVYVQVCCTCLDMFYMCVHVCYTCTCTLYMYMYMHVSCTCTRIQCMFLGFKEVALSGSKPAYLYLRLRLIRVPQLDAGRNKNRVIIFHRPLINSFMFITPQ